MAKVSHFFSGWASSGPGNDMAPGQAHGWIMWGFGYGDAVSVSVHPVVGAPVERFLQVENVRIQGDPAGRRLFFTVRNVGNSFVPGYGMGFGWISA
ncbi:MAG: hypothetical protein KIT09_05715 [Bryobacteraceae bacterium]|nr:hypothetical protein [Bryobacteraceae bacterium]